MQNIQKDVSTKAKTAETAERNADTAKIAAQNAQKAAEKGAGNAANSESAAKASAEQAAAARDTAQELAGRVTVDDTLSDASASPVQNKVIFAALAKSRMCSASLSSSTALTAAWMPSWPTNLNTV